MKQFGNPPFQLTLLFLSNFFMTPLFVQISKVRTPAPPSSPILGERKLCSHWEMFCKKGVLLCHVSMMWTLVDLFCTKRLFSQETVFSPYYFTRDKDGFVLQRISYSRAINKVKTGSLCRIFNYLTKHLKVPDNCI